MKGIIGALSGDIIGSTREFYPIKRKDFELFEHSSRFTDDTVMTLAVASWLIKNKKSKKVLISELQTFARRYPNSGYGGSFSRWIKKDHPKPYNSWGNGSAMRVSPVAWIGRSISEVQKLSLMSSVVTHDNPEGIRVAMAVGDAVYLARTGKSKHDIKKHIERKYFYDLRRSVGDIRKDYTFDVSCQGSVGEAIICFLDGEDFEDTIRNAVSLGGDADTQAAIAGSIASAYWDVPPEISSKTISYLDEYLLEVLLKFNDLVQI